MTAVDVDYAALTVARANARRHGVRVRFFCGDWFGPLTTETFDLIVSNPPYVASGDPHLADLRFEPQGALLAGADGLDCIRDIAGRAGAHLRPGAWLLLEHGQRQEHAVRELLAGAGLQSITTWPDLAGIARITGGKLES